MQVAANVENWHGKFNIGGGGGLKEKGKNSTIEPGEKNCMPKGYEYNAREYERKTLFC